MTLCLSDVNALLDGWYDPGTAESWDAVGLVCGDPDQPVAKVLFAVDPAPAVVAATPCTAVSSSGWCTTTRSAPHASASSTTAGAGSTAKRTFATGWSGSPHTSPTASQDSAVAGSYQPSSSAFTSERDRVMGASLGRVSRKDAEDQGSRREQKLGANGGRSRDRTCDHLVVSEVLYR